MKTTISEKITEIEFFMIDGPCSTPTATRTNCARNYDFIRATTFETYCTRVSILYIVPIGKPFYSYGTENILCHSMSTAVAYSYPCYVLL